MNNINNNTNNNFSNLSNSERDLYDKISELVDIPDVMRILDSSEFFRKEYLQQEFKQSSRFKIDKIHLKKGVQLKESHEKRLKDKGKTSIKFSSDNRPNEELQLSNFVEQKPTLRYFTMGSIQYPIQFERWSPEEMYNWWLKLRISSISKSEWKILDAVFFLFINQISRICNSYIKYGIKNRLDNQKELELLSKYFLLLDEFYKSGGQYKLMIDTHFAFCEWFEYRISYEPFFNMNVQYENETSFLLNIFNEKKENKIRKKIKIGFDRKRLFLKLKTYINDSIEKSNDYCLVLFTSYFQNPLNFLSLYGIPVITIIGVPNKSHNGIFYSPSSQILHDFMTHGECLKKYYKYIYSQYPLNDIELFKQKMIFLQILWNKKKSDAQLFLWFILHESECFEILLIIKNDLKNKLSNVLQDIKSKNSSFCENFFEINIFLEQLLNFKFVVQTIIDSDIDSEKEKIVLPRIFNCIDILIETCHETLKKIERNENNENNKKYILSFIKYIPNKS